MTCEVYRKQVTILMEQLWCVLRLPVPYYNQKLFGWEHHSCAENGVLMAGNVLSSDKETIPARYAIKVQAQVFMENGELLLPILKTFAQCSHSLHTSKTFWCFQCVCVVVEQSVAPTTTVAGVHRTAPDTPQPSQGSSCDVWTVDKKVLSVSTERTAGTWRYKVHAFWTTVLVGSVWLTAHSVQFAHTECYALKPLGKNESYYT